MVDRQQALRPLLAALADGQWHSGEQLAAEAGCSRAALAKRVAHLRDDYRLDIAATAGRGYRLQQALDLLDADAIRAAVGPQAGRVTVLDSIDSTNRWLLDAPAAEDPQLCTAEMQSAGRGRRGRAWASPFGQSLYISVSYGFAHTAAALGALPLAMGVSAAGVLEAFGAPQIGLKWPNDLVHDGAKLGGLLCEARGEMGGNFRVVVGLGVNVRHHPALDGLDQPATSLERLGATVSRSALAGTLGAALLAACERFAAKGLAAFAEDFAARDALRDRSVTVQEATAWQGIARGVDAAGALQVQTADGGLRAVHAGDVSVRAAS
jgi:BirA family biotin operon repressor/biotin-[acetyl-CoA-carboxylase] ligase